LYGAIHEFDAFLRRFYEEDNSLQEVEKQRNKPNLDFHFYYAKALYLLGEEENSIEYFQEAKERIEIALSLDPKNPSFLSFRLSCLAEKVS
jgi:tetratricopeptide (TPR) repeat protein